MNIAVIGAGNVGGALARIWAAKGHRVRLGVRDPGRREVGVLLESIGHGISAHSNAEAAGASEVVVLATPWEATRNAVESCGSLAGKTVIDCTNPLLPDLAGLEVGHSTSGAERVAAWAKGASVFKCFNQTGSNNMEDQKGYAHRPVMFVAGDNAERKPGVLQLARECGFDAVDAGPLTIARLLEPLAMLWIHLAYRMGMGRNFAWTIVRR